MKASLAVSSAKAILLNQSRQIDASVGESCNREGATGILAFFATLPRPRRRANFTMPQPEQAKADAPSMNQHPTNDLLTNDLVTNNLSVDFFR